MPHPRIHAAWAASLLQKKRGGRLAWAFLQNCLEVSEQMSIEEVSNIADSHSQTGHTSYTYGDMLRLVYDWSRLLTHLLLPSTEQTTDKKAKKMSAVVGIILPSSALSYSLMHAAHLTGVTFLPLNVYGSSESLWSCLESVSCDLCIMSSSAWARLSISAQIDMEVEQLPPPSDTAGHAALYRAWHKRSRQHIRVLICNAGVPVLDGVTVYNLDESEDSATMELAAPPCMSIIATSGSTGEPKLVRGTEMGLENRVDWMQHIFFDSCDSSASVYACTSPLAFVDALYQVFGPMASRVKAVILDAHIVQTPALLLKALSRYRISHVTLVPAILERLVRWLQLSPEAGSLSFRLAPSLRGIICSGEPLSERTAYCLKRALPKACRLLNVYGCSEAAGDSTVMEIRTSRSSKAAGTATTGEVGEGDDEKGGDGSTVPLGCPIPGHDVYLALRSEQGEVLCLQPLTPSSVFPGAYDLPEGQAASETCGALEGEICLGGVGLGLGYLGVNGISDAGSALASASASLHLLPSSGAASSSPWPPSSSSVSSFSSSSSSPPRFVRLPVRRNMVGSGAVLEYADVFLTGDAGRLDPVEVPARTRSFFLRWTGRMDRVTKLFGVKVALGQVEAAIKAGIKALGTALGTAFVNVGVVVVRGHAASIPPPSSRPSLAVINSEPLLVAVLQFTGSHAQEDLGCIAAALVRSEATAVSISVSQDVWTRLCLLVFPPEAAWPEKGAVGEFSSVHAFASLHARSATPLLDLLMKAGAKEDTEVPPSASSSLSLSSSSASSLSFSSRSPPLVPLPSAPSLASLLLAPPPLPALTYESIVHIVSGAVADIMTATAFTEGPSSLHVDIFLAGADSILATYLALRIRDALGAVRSSSGSASPALTFDFVSAAAIAVHRTVHAMAAFILTEAARQQEGHTLNADAPAAKKRKLDCISSLHVSPSVSMTPPSLPSSSSSSASPSSTLEISMWSKAVRSEPAQTWQATPRPEWSFVSSLSSSSSSSSSFSSSSLRIDRAAYVVATVDALDTQHPPASVSMMSRVDLGECIDATAAVAVCTLRGAGLQGQASPSSVATTYIGCHSGEVVAVQYLRSFVAASTPLPASASVCASAPAVSSLSSTSILWSRLLPDRVESSPCLSNDGHVLFVGCNQGSLFALSAADGQVLCSFLTEQDVKCGPLVDMQTGDVWVGSYDKTLYCLRLVESSAPASSSSSLVSPLPSSASASASFLSPAICESPSYRFDLMFHQRCRGSIFASPAILYLGVPGVPPPPGGSRRAVIYCVDLSGSVVAIGSVWPIVGSPRSPSTTFEVLWTFDIGAPLFSSPVVASRALPASAPLSPSSPPSSSLSRLAGSLSPPDVLVVCAVDGAAYGFNTTSGEVLWRMTTAAAPIFSSPVYVPALKTVLVGCHDGCLYCFDPFDFFVTEGSSSLSPSKSRGCLRSILKINGGDGSPIVAAPSYRHFSPTRKEGDVTSTCLQASLSMCLVCFCTKDGVMSIAQVDKVAGKAHAHVLIRFPVCKGLPSSPASSASSPSMSLHESMDTVVRNANGRVERAPVDSNNVVQGQREVFSAPLWIDSSIFIGTRDNHFYYFHIDESIDRPFKCPNK